MAPSIPASLARQRTMYQASTRDIGRPESLPVLPIAARQNGRPGCQSNDSSAVPVGSSKRTRLPGRLYGWTANCAFGFRRSPHRESSISISRKYSRGTLPSHRNIPNTAFLSRSSALTEKRYSPYPKLRLSIASEQHQPVFVLTIARCNSPFAATRTPSGPKRFDPGPTRLLLSFTVHR
jgi:hypothetical protein